MTKATRTLIACLLPLTLMAAEDERVLAYKCTENGKTIYTIEPCRAPKEAREREQRLPLPTPDDGNLKRMPGPKK